MTLDIVNPEIDRYLNDKLAVENPTLREMGDYGAARGFPIIGPQSGRLINLLAQAIHARQVLELGSGFGYSGMWFALAVGEGGRVVMTEGSKENVDRARDYFDRAGLTSRAEFNVGDAFQLAEKYPGPFDVVFCDVDKEGYPKALEVARAKLRVGGILIFDNMLWHGRILELKDQDADTNGVRDATRLLLAERDFFTTIVPVRDGVSVSLRLA